MIEIQVLDADGIIEKFSLLPKELDKVVQSTVKKVTNQVQRKIQDELKTYPRHKPRQSYKIYKPFWTPSPPGEPPAQVTTNLRRSVKTEPIVKKGFGHYEQVVGNTAVYARAQELGNPSTGLPARPFIRPVLRRMESTREIDRLFEQVVLKQLEKRYPSKKS